MELEEGLAATEQVIQLLDQIINQGKQSIETSDGITNPFNITTDEKHDETFVGYGKLTGKIIICVVTHIYIYNQQKCQIIELEKWRIPDDKNTMYFENFRFFTNITGQNF